MATDRDLRARVMRRSRRLGHCVCEPGRACPCETLRRHDVCPCAGERLPAAGPEAPLTASVRRPGCASKVPQDYLLRALARLPKVTDPAVLVGAAAGDDAGVYRLSADQALVQTVDVFTPCVDDPFLFGRIAAANSLSDVYAMAGKPLTALSVLCYPSDLRDDAAMVAMLAGGQEALAEAGCVPLGGHSVNDAEIKLGYAVTGLVHPDAVARRAGGRAGDALVLTKPLGTGLAAFGRQLGRLSPDALRPVEESMARLNRRAAGLMAGNGASGCTDVTGFGLAGHLVEMARDSGCTAEVEVAALPAFAAALACLEADAYPGAVEKNAVHAAGLLQADAEAETWMPLLYGPETSGGLLVALPAGRAAAYVEALAAEGHAAAVIGRLVPPLTGVALRVRGGGPPRMIGPAVKLLPPVAAPVQAPAQACCAGPAAAVQPVPPPFVAPEGAPAPSMAAFQAFLKEATRPGALDAKQKKLLAVALSVATRCAPCLDIHLKSALGLGLTRQELEEAVAVALVFGGGPAYMSWQEGWQRVAGDKP